MKFQSDILDVPVEASSNQRNNGSRCGILAGLAVGYWKNQDEIKEQWHMDKRFEPTMEAKTSERAICWMEKSN